MKTKAYLVGCACAALLVLITLISASARSAFNTYPQVLIILACVLVLLMILVRRRPTLAFGTLGLAVGALLSLALAQKMPRVGEHRHALAPAASSVAEADAVAVDQRTRFDVVLLFSKDTSGPTLEQFIQSILKQVHVQSCVHKLPCVARLLRLSQIGPAQNEVVAFDLMADTPQFERVALISAAQQHLLKPALFQSTSALAAAQTTGL